MKKRVIRFGCGLTCLLLAVLVSSAAPVRPQGDTGTIEVRVVRRDTLEGIPGARVYLQGPGPILTAATLSPLYIPDPALTVAMREQIDALIASASPVMPSEILAMEATRMQAQLLGLPVPEEANATILGPRFETPPSAITDANGQIHFKNLAPGHYSLQAGRDGYYGEIPAGSTAVQHPKSINAFVNVIAGQTSPDVVMPLMPGGSISGIVRDPGGQPAVGLPIAAYLVAYEDGRANLLAVNTSTTDDRGDYRLFGLPPGEYYIAAVTQSPSGTLTRSPSGTLTRSPTVTPNGGMAGTFFPGVIDGKDAQTVTLGQASDVPSVNFSVLPDVRVSGRVQNPFKGPDGKASEVSRIYLLRVDPNGLTVDAPMIISNSPMNPANPINDGRFEYRKIPPGDYDLMASALDGAGMMWGRKRIHVGADGLQDVTMQIHSGIEVKAHLTLDGAPPSFTMAFAPNGVSAPIATIGNSFTITSVKPASVSPVRVPVPAIRLALRTAGYRSEQADRATNENMTFDPSGIYVFPNVIEGRYYLQTSPLPPNAYIADVQMDGMSIYDSGFDTGNLSGPIEVTIRSNGIKLQGTVVDSAKKPFASSTIALVPEQSRRQNPLLYKTSRSDAIGNFTFTGVAPGEYKLFAWEMVPANAWTNAEFLAKYEDRSQSISVNADGTAKIELKLIPK